MNRVTLIPEVKTTPIDFTSAYASLVPFVAQAFAYMECGKTDIATECLSRAMQIIEATNNFPLYTIRHQDTVSKHTASPFDLPDLEKVVAEKQNHNLF